MIKDTLLVFGIALFITACGVDTDSSKNLVEGSSAALGTDDNSYRNFKKIGLSPQSLPVLGNARAYGNFSGGTELDLFVARVNYWPPSSTTPEAASPSTFAFYRKSQEGSYTLDATLLSTDEGCIHPRKAVVADFNLDEQQDVFVACHGYDATPYPGEKNKIVLSQDDGTYQISDASDDIGFFHSASAADLNGDSYPDIVLTDNFDTKSVIVLINNKDGTFQREKGVRLPAILGGKPYFSIELVDINNDNILDLVVGGHEWEGAATYAFLNPGDNVFEGVTPMTIPAVTNEGVVLDFVATGSDTSSQLWVLRTSGGDGTFYQSRVLQRVNLTDLSSSVVINDRPANWVRWIIPTDISGQSVIASENESEAFNYAY